MPRNKLGNKTPITEKQEYSNLNKPQTNKNRNTTHPNNAEQTLT